MTITAPDVDEDPSRSNDNECPLVSPCTHSGIIPSDLALSLKSLSSDTSSFWTSGRVPHLSRVPSGRYFYRKFVSRSVPCVVSVGDGTFRRRKGAGRVPHMPAGLTVDDLMRVMGQDAKVTVDLTPDGRGDCVRNVEGRTGDVERMFLRPMEVTMTMGDFVQGMRTSEAAAVAGGAVDNRVSGIKPFPVRRDGSRTKVPDALTLRSELDDDQSAVFYYSRQNDCVRTELPSLFATGLIPSNIPFAAEAFFIDDADEDSDGSDSDGPSTRPLAEPEAINLWVGGSRSVSAEHRDPYENIFYVCSGTKFFDLRPPSDVGFLREAEFTAGAFAFDRDAGGWHVVPDGENTVRWIDSSDCDNPEASCGTPSRHIRVKVRAGEMIYIPSLWFHRVSQTEETVGVNYWFDMVFDAKWCYYNFVGTVGALLHDNLKKRRQKEAEDETGAIETESHENIKKV